nr:hypothetical protein [uncultured Flavobacterium sp.]
MITEIQRIALAKILPTRYAPLVSKLLQERNITNRQGNLYTSTMISMVFTGQRANAEIEQAIFDVAETLKKESEGRDYFLGIKKPAVDAAGV